MTATFLRKTGDTSRASTTAVAADPDLVLACAASTIYRFAGTAVFYANTTPQIQLRWRYTGTLLSAAGFMRMHTVKASIASPPPLSVNDYPVGPGYLTAGAAESGSGSVTATHRGLMHIVVLFKTDTAGNIEMQWAQNTSSGTASVMKAGSWMLLEPLS